MWGCEGGADGVRDVKEGQVCGDVRRGRCVWGCEGGADGVRDVKEGQVCVGM